MKTTVIKPILLGVFLTAATPAAFAQGTLLFSTYNSDPAFGRVFLADGATPVSDAFFGQIWFSDVGPAASLSPAGPPEFFSAALPGYVQDGSVSFPADAPGTTVWLQLRVWNYQAGYGWPPIGNPEIVELGMSGIASCVLGGVAPGGTVFPTQQFNNFPTFLTYDPYVPEPSTFTLVSLGFVTLLVFGRRHG
jgi:hypothetical protein